MKKHALVALALVSLISTSCGEAMSEKPKVVSKRTKVSALGADAVAKTNVPTNNGGNTPTGNIPGTNNPSLPMPTDPSGGGSSTATPPPVDTGMGQSITLGNGCYRGDQFLCQIEIAIANKTNAYRAARGPITYSASMGWVARDWSMQQAAANSLGHQGFPAARYSKFSAEFGASSPVNFGAENVAYAFGTSTSPDEIADELMNLWITSTGHRDNILGNFRTLGVGVAKTGNYYYGTQLFGK